MVVLEKTLESPLDSKEINPLNPKWNQPWIFIGRADTEAETPILWPRDAKNWLTGKDPDAQQDWRQEEKGMTEDEMAGWHHQLDGHEFEQAPGVGDGQGSLQSMGSQRVGHDWATELTEDNVHQYVVRKPWSRDDEKTRTKAPKIQRLFTPRVLQHKCQHIALKKQCTKKIRKRLQNMLNFGPREQGRPKKSARNRLSRTEAILWELQPLCLCPVKNKMFWK